ncbi:unnamed protein product [Phytophthora fragariaefolia]|uniref:Unnamed protein product n=1 Tax=Phytophthora fragariaefolia TaxID=1490495 RepID=A0A9W6Y1F7_9STRA|nr:unnamed protein product [Phytophthora fragariaefolia]
MLAHSTTTSSKPSSDQSTAGERKRPALPCAKCDSPEHSVRHCPHAQPGEAEKVIAEVRERKQAKQRLHTKKLRVPPGGGVPSGSSSEGTPTAPSHVIAVADGLEMTTTLLDSGSDDTLISRAAVEALLKFDPGLDLRDAPTPAYGNPVGGQLVVLSRLARIRKVSLATSAGTLVLRNLRCWVDETDEKLNITIGRPMMERLGYSVDAFLVTALTNSEATPLEDFALTPKFKSDDVAPQRVQVLFVKGLKDAPTANESVVGQAELCDLFDRVTQKRADYGLKLHPGKCVFFTKSIKWCGRVISAAGVTHCPDRIQGLVDMAPPITAADLQQLLCSANWMRTSIPEYADITGPLYKTLEVAMKITGSRKKSKLQKTKLDESQWGQEETASLNNLKDAPARITPLAHPRADWDVCLFTDASAEYWGAVAIQIPPGDLERPRGEQRNEPLAFLSGKFVGAASR